MTPDPATTLAAEFAAVMADVALDVSGVSYAVGRAQAAAHASPPHVLWTPVRGSIEGGRKQAHPSGARVLFTRVLTLRARCWGATTEAASSLVDAVLRAAHTRWTAGASTPGDEAWPTEETDATALGEYVDLTLTLRLAVLDRAPARVTLTAATLDTTGAVAGDGTLHLGEH